MKSFNLEKEIFDQIDLKINSKKYKNNVEEFKLLIKKLYMKYDPKINENKFIVGHVVEIFLSLLLKSMGYLVKIEGSNKFNYDILINNFEFSIKSSSKPKSTIILKNIHGKNSDFSLKYPVILVELGTGILYFDPEDIDKNQIQIIKKKDGFDIKGKDVHKISKKIILSSFPTKKEIYKTNTIKERTASEDVSNYLLSEYSKILINFNE